MRGARSTPPGCTSCPSTRPAPPPAAARRRSGPAPPRISTSAGIRKAATSCGRWPATSIRRNRHPEPGGRHRARAIAWMFAALNTVVPPIAGMSMAHVLVRKEPWFEARLPLLHARVRTRLPQPFVRLGAGEWLEGGFSAGDLMMIGVLLRLGGHGLLEEFENVAAYVARGEARPAYRRAFAAQRAVFEASAGG